MTLLAVENLRVSFASETGPVAAVHDVSFSVSAGEVLGIVGESGSGKTLSLLSVLGLVDKRVTTVTGRAVFRGRSLLDLPDREMRKIRGRDIALISQDPMTALTPVHTIGAQIVEQIRAHEPVSRAAARARAVELLRDVRIPAPEKALDRYPHELSGGHAPARGDRHGAVVQPRAGGGGRADDSAGHHGSGAGSRPLARAAAKPWVVGGADHA